jgi:hypothetical protein
MSHAEFNTAELPSDVLMSRYNELDKLDTIPRSEERRNAIQHELACIAFELSLRMNENTPEFVASSDKLAA